MRIKFIDISRCFAIFLIVLGHTIVHSIHNQTILKVIYSFHVALFFMISGFLFKEEDISIIEYIKKKILRIMLPYFIWAILFLIPYYLFGREVSEQLNAKASFSISESLINILIGNGNGGALRQHSSLWFLPALFTTEVFYFLISKLRQKFNIKKIIILIISFILAFIVYYTKIPILPWGMSTTLVFGPLYYVGYLFKSYNLINDENVKQGKTTIFFIIALCLGGTAIYFNPISISVMDYKFGILPLAYISGICLSYCVFVLSALIKENKILEFVGINTMGILIFHKLPIVLFQTKIPITSKLLLNSNLATELSLGIIISIISVVLSLIATIIIKKYFPFLFGESKQKL